MGRRIGGSPKAQARFLDRIEGVRSPAVIEVTASPGGRDERDINQAERGGVFEQQGEQVAIVEKALASVITERAVLLVADIQVPGIASHIEISAGGLHEPKELAGRDPSAGRALADGFPPWPPVRIVTVLGAERAGLKP